MKHKDEARGYVKHYEGPRTQDLTTPREFFDKLHRKYRFTLDGAATRENALLPRWRTEGDCDVWTGERVFCNPPWGNIPYFVELASSADLAVLLVPARTNCGWFHRALKLKAKPAYWKGKLRFGNSKWNSPVDCLLLIFRKRRSTDETR